jgi:hypothetical protein
VALSRTELYARVKQIGNVAVTEFFVYNLSLLFLTIFLTFLYSSVRVLFVVLFLDSFLTYSITEMCTGSKRLKEIFLERVQLIVFTLDPNQTFVSKFDYDQKDYYRFDLSDEGMVWRLYIDILCFV